MEEHPMEELPMMNKNENEDSANPYYKNENIPVGQILLILLACGIFYFLILGSIFTSSQSSDLMEERSRSLYNGSTQFVKHDELVAESGDLIEFQRIVGIYSHWGVYVGKKFVIHLTFGKNGVEIRKDKLDVVANDGVCRVNNLESAAINRGLKPREKHIAVSAAFAYLNQFRKGTVEYNIAKFNCEHFATLCLYNEAFSEQGDSVKNKSTIHFLSIFFDSSVAS